MINKHLTARGASWPLYAAISAYAMNTFATTVLQGLSPFELVFARKPRQLSSFEIPKINNHSLWNTGNSLSCYSNGQKCIETWT